VRGWLHQVVSSTCNPTSRLTELHTKLHFAPSEPALWAQAKEAQHDIWGAPTIIGCTREDRVLQGVHDSTGLQAQIR
jgi:hypothetical protein